jgi:CheY-like chemotaxis protein
VAVGRTRSSESIVVAKRVLVVEDDAAHRDICVTIRRHHHYEVVDAADGKEALRMVGEYPPDLVLMDVLLPVVDGWQATATLKGAPATEDIPVVILTTDKPDSRLRRPQVIVRRYAAARG